MAFCIFPKQRGLEYPTGANSMPQFQDLHYFYPTHNLKGV